MTSLTAFIGYSGLSARVPSSVIMVFTFIFLRTKANVPSSICGMVPSIRLLSTKRSPSSPSSPISFPCTTIAVTLSCGKNSWGYSLSSINPANVGRSS